MSELGAVSFTMGGIPKMRGLSLQAANELLRYGYRRGYDPLNSLASYAPHQWWLNRAHSLTPEQKATLNRILKSTTIVLERVP